ncbi:9257_t:CDS:2 [Ambispora gerdemannii]|uniref:9257_t:CDS:1 n=1 Tax=Ambispora gerdemannii TaxID=144530 RepID=A0A9N9CA21_9GLOM|nr:9257_t:CDS:2 [Ambispora gerdemannii]
MTAMQTEDMNDHTFLQNQLRELRNCIDIIWSNTYEAVSKHGASGGGGHSNAIRGKIPREPTDYQKEAIKAAHVEFNEIMNQVYMVVQDAKYTLHQEYLLTKQKEDAGATSSSTMTGIEIASNSAANRELVKAKQRKKLQELRKALGIIQDNAKDDELQETKTEKGKSLAAAATSSSSSSVSLMKVDDADVIKIEDD